MLPEYDVVYICRTSAWVPTWYDDLWMEFIEWWNQFNVWSTKITCPFAMKKRSPNMEQAVKLAEEYEKMQKRMKNFQSE